MICFKHNKHSKSPLAGRAYSRSFIETLYFKEAMSKIREPIETAFKDDELDRVDKYIDDIRASLISTNQQFGRYTFLLFLSLFSYHLVLLGQTTEVSILGFTLGSKAFIIKWFLVLPSILLLLQATAGYLRVYQQESIEWLLAKYRNSEYEAGLYRVAFPSSHILSVDLMRRLGTDISPASLNLLTSIFVLFSVWLPSFYILGAYIYAISIYQGDWQVIVSFVISSIILVQKSLVVRRSQEI